MLALTLKKGDKVTTLLTAGLTFGILITWTGIPQIIIIGIIIYMLSALMIALTCLKKNKLPKLFKLAIVLAGILAFVANLFSILHYPYAEIIRLCMILPIVFYIISLARGMIKRKEFGYLTIMNVDFILRLI